MPRPIEQSVVVITGASSGIGRASALMFAERGATVILAARRAEALEALARECDHLGGHALAVPTDTTDEAAVQRLARLAVDHFRRIDVWVNNAAVTLFGRIEQTPPEAYRRVIETNVFGYVHGARAVVPLFRSQGAGVLINVSSMVSRVGQPYTSAYVASKWAITGLSECLRQELLDAPDVHVCTVLPASIDTPLFQQAANYSGREIRAMTPVYDARQVASAIVGLCESPRREAFVGNAGRMLALLKLIAPGIAERNLAQRVERDHLGELPAPPTAGNLFEPMPQYASVSGGWYRRNQGRGARRFGGIAVAGLAAGIGLAIWWLRERSGGSFELPDRRQLRRWADQARPSRLADVLS